MKRVFLMPMLYRRWPTYLAVVLVTAILLVFLLYRASPRISVSVLKRDSKRVAYTEWPPYSSPPSRPSDWYNHLCFEGLRESSMERLGKNLELLSRAVDPFCRSIYEQFQNIYTLDFHTGSVKLPDEFKEKVFQWLGNDKETMEMIYAQPVIHAFNEYTMEQTIHSPVRSRRPLKPPSIKPLTYFQADLESTKRNCDFCKFKTNTAFDEFGRLESNYSFTAANAFKLDHWHGLVALKSHSLLNASAESINDLMNMAFSWFDRVRTVDKTAKYPMLDWDHTAHGGASQFHPHMHAFFGTSHYFGNFEKYRRAAQTYLHNFYGRNYFKDIVEIHLALGLAVTYGSATAVVEMTERGDGEFVLYSAKADSDLFDLLFFVLKTYMVELNMFSFSGGMAFPIMDDDKKGKFGSLPAIIRITTRGSVSDVFSEISGFDLYLSPNTVRDPYKLVNLLKSVIDNTTIH